MIFTTKRIDHAEGRTVRRKITKHVMTNFAPGRLSLDFQLIEYIILMNEGNNEPVIPRSRSTLSLSRTCSFFPVSFFLMVPVSYQASSVQELVTRVNYAPLEAFQAMLQSALRVIVGLVHTCPQVSIYRGLALHEYHDRSGRTVELFTDVCNDGEVAG